MDYEDILVNLKVLEKVEVNEKLISRGKYLNIEYASIVPVSIRRWIRQDNRNEMLKKIKLVIQSGLNILNEYQEHFDKSINRNQILDDTNDESKKDILKIYLQKSISGMTKLKETYNHCTQTCAQIDVLIESISSEIE